MIVGPGPVEVPSGSEPPLADGCSLPSFPRQRLDKDHRPLMPIARDWSLTIVVHGILPCSWSPGR